MFKSEMPALIISGSDSDNLIAETIQKGCLNSGRLNTNAESNVLQKAIVARSHDDVTRGYMGDLAKGGPGSGRKSGDKVLVKPESKNGTPRTQYTGTVAETRHNVLGLGSTEHLVTPDSGHHGRWVPEQHVHDHPDAKKSITKDLGNSVRKALGMIIGIGMDTGYIDPAEEHLDFEYGIEPFSDADKEVVGYLTKIEKVNTNDYTHNNPAEPAIAGFPMTEKSSRADAEMADYLEKSIKASKPEHNQMPRHAGGANPRPGDPGNSVKPIEHEQHNSMAGGKKTLPPVPAKLGNSTHGGGSGKVGSSRPTEGKQHIGPIHDKISATSGGSHPVGSSRPAAGKAKHAKGGIDSSNTDAGSGSLGAGHVGSSRPGDGAPRKAQGAGHTSSNAYSGSGELAGRAGSARPGDGAAHVHPEHESGGNATKQGSGIVGPLRTRKSVAEALSDIQKAGGLSAGPTLKPAKVASFSSQAALPKKPNIASSAPKPIGVKKPTMAPKPPSTHKQLRSAQPVKAPSAGTKFGGKNLTTKSLSADSAEFVLKALCDE